MSQHDVEAAIERMAKQGKAGAMTMAAPLNDAQLLSLVAGMLHTSKSSPTEADVEESVRAAAAIVAKSVVAVRTGFLQKTINATVEEEVAAGASTGEGAN